MEATNEIGTNPAGAQSRGAEGGTNLSVGLAACLAALVPCKKCGGSPTPLIGGSLLSPEYYWGCRECGAKPYAAKTYAGAWDKWQKHNKAANVKLRGCARVYSRSPA